MNRPKLVLLAISALRRLTEQATVEDLGECEGSIDAPGLLPVNLWKRLVRSSLISPH
jgi:hypothetical protein